MALLLIFTAAILLIVYLIKYMKYSKPENFPPGPLRWPITGNYLQLLLENYRFPYKAIHNMAKRYKTNVLGMYLGPFLAVVACDEKSVREALLHPDFQGRPHAFAPKLRCCGDLLGILFSDGDLWQKQKRFTLHHMRDFGFGRRFESFETKLHEAVQELLDVIRNGNSEFAKNNSIFLPEIFMHIGACLPLSIFANTKYANGELQRKLLDTLFPLGLTTEASGGAINLHPWLRFLVPGTVGYTDSVIGNYYAREFVSELIEEHKERKTDSTVMDFLDVYLEDLKTVEEKGENKNLSSEHQLLIIGFDLVLASTITIAYTLGNAIEYMLHYPEIQKKVQEEIYTVVGQNRLPDLNDRKSMPYTEATIREVMRHETLLPLSILHRATKDTVFCGYNIPVDTLVITSLYGANNDPKVWDNPTKFEPKHFLDSNGQLLKKDISLPFGIGKRVCAGETFARQNIFVTFSSLLQNFTFSVLPGQKLPDFNTRLPGIAIGPNKSWVKATPRN